MLPTELILNEFVTGDSAGKEPLANTGELAEKLAKVGVVEGSLVKVVGAVEGSPDKVAFPLLVTSSILPWNLTRSSAMVRTSSAALISSFFCWIKSYAELFNT